MTGHLEFRRHADEPAVVEQLRWLPSDEVEGRGKWGRLDVAFLLGCRTDGRARSRVPK